ncbi:copper resistance CopC family protein, partial [Roseisolibacter sp. H3M3-2]|uniref:copper resistance CopC family protein n=1 Tax=Roseisolibacter sp. H3M3-2 TaxID=3031323 RepID=UPI0023DC9967
MIALRRAARRLALALALLLPFLEPRAAGAPGALRSSAPARGSRLAAVPRTLRLTFTERVELAVTRLALVGPGGRAVALSAPRAGDAPTVVVADVAGPVVAGAYEITWQVAGRDGHPVRGRIPFTVLATAAGLADTPPPASPAPASPAPAPSAPAARAVAAHVDTVVSATIDAADAAGVAGRWVGFAATLAIAGAIGLALLVAPRAAATAAVGQ